MNIDPAQIKNMGSYVELILGGGVSSVLAMLWLYHKFVVLVQKAEQNKKIEDLWKGTERKYEEFAKELKNERESFLEFMHHFKKTETTLAEVEGAQRNNHEEIREMRHEDKLIKQELTFLKEKMSSIENSVTSLKTSFDDLRVVLLQALVNK